MTENQKIASLIQTLSEAGDKITIMNIEYIVIPATAFQQIIEALNKPNPLEREE